MRAPKKTSAAPKRGEPASLLRALPQIDQVLQLEEARAAASRHGRSLVAVLLRQRLEGIRKEIRAGGLDGDAVAERIGALGAWLQERCGELAASTLRPVINATGVILHTNLGRAILPESAARRMTEAARAYTTLEYDLTRGQRGSRSSHLDRVFGLLFPGKSVLVVNNNAAAVLLALNTLGEGREVVVSRGELVEIGGSFRVPDIMRKSGAILREVGTTNRTRLGDYERALGPRTALILKVHPSNYRIVGFTQQAGLREICALARRHRLPVLMDQGSGNLVDLEVYGIRDEPTVQQALAAGAAVVACSGDKLLGGPQAGLLVGRAELIKRMKENPLSRAVRADKTTFAALEAVLLEHARGTAVAALPVLGMIALGAEAIERRARRLAENLGPRVADRLVITIVRGASLAGGGSAPEEGLPTALLAVRSPVLSARAIERELRRGAPPVIARIEGGVVLLDLRTVPEDQDGIVREALEAVALQTLNRKLITSPSRTT